MLLEEKCQLERVYLNDRIGLTSFHVGVIDGIDKKIHQIDTEIAQLFKVQPMHKSTSMKDLKIITFEEFREERKSLELLSEREDIPPPHVSEDESLKEFKKSEEEESSFTTIEPEPEKKLSEKLKDLIIYILTHETYIRE